MYLEDIINNSQLDKLKKGDTISFTPVESEPSVKIKAMILNNYDAVDEKINSAE